MLELIRRMNAEREAPFDDLAVAGASAYHP
jgi:hypothetical protein